MSNLLPPNSSLLTNTNEDLNTVSAFFKLLKTTGDRDPLPDKKRTAKKKAGKLLCLKYSFNYSNANSESGFERSSPTESREIRYKVAPRRNAMKRELFKSKAVNDLYCL